MREAQIKAEEIHNGNTDEQTGPLGLAGTPGKQPYIEKHTVARMGVTIMIQTTTCSRAKGFTVWEKAWAQASFLVTGTVGTVGIALTDWRWIFPYIVIYWYGIPGIVMRHTNCPRCPHLHEYGDCVQAPTRLTRWLVKGRKTTPFSNLERSLFYGIFILIPTYPLYWLLPHTGLLVAFVIAAGAWYAGQFLHLCRRCRVSDCPFNRAFSTRQASGV